MLHSFVAARLLPRLPTWARYGQRVLPSLTTKPFLALHNQLPTEQTHFSRNPNLFVISSQRPTSLGSEYFVLNQTETNARTLTVVPPLPFKVPLYLFVTPCICAAFEDASAYQRLANAEKYQLDGASLERLLNALKEARPSIPATLETGGDDEPAPDWDTWSGDSPREAPGAFVWRRQVQFFFDLIPFESLPTDFELHVFDELALLRQLTLDYTWEGCGLITEYIESMRGARTRLAASGRLFRLPILPICQPDPSVDALLPCTPHLQSLPVIHDGDPHINEEQDELADDWKNEEDIDVVEMPLAVPVPAVEMKDVNVIVLDSNVLIDRDGPLQNALTRIFPPSQHQFTPKELLDLYVEHETLRAADGQPDSPTAIVQNVARYLSVSVDESAVSTALEYHAQPRLYPETSTLIESFIEQGYSLLALPSSCPKDLALLPQRPGLPSLPTSSSGSWKWESLLQNYPTLRRSQILVVTSDIYRTAEPASVTGFPTALIKRAGSRSAKLSIPTTPPTLTLATLAELFQALKEATSVPKSQDPVVDEAYPPMRIHDCYQVTYLLGSGSFSYVFNAIQVHTGAGVAIKFEPTPTTLPYEAAVYAQLEGVPGLPRIHWSGKERNAYVMVMDKLGPNLEQLRKVCRGRFGLRTVLMLGEQMLSTISVIHARGIIVRDIKPENFAMGLVEEYKRLHLLDLGLCKLWLDPTTGKHIPFREGRAGIGTPRYASGHVHFGLEPSRRDDVEAIGFLLLYLLHGRLPWQGICAPTIPAKLRRMGEMKTGKPFADLLAHETTPQFFAEYFEHCRRLAFDEQPDYRMLRRLFRREFEGRGWGDYDWEYDWWHGNSERGTLLPGEYRLDAQLVDPVRHQQHAL